MTVDEDVIDQDNNAHFIAMTGHNLVISCYYSEKSHYAIADYHKIKNNYYFGDVGGSKQCARAAGGYWTIAITFHSNAGQPVYSYGEE